MNPSNLNSANPFEDNQLTGSPDYAQEPLDFNLLLQAMIQPQPDLNSSSISSNLQQMSYQEPFDFFSIDIPYQAPNEPLQPHQQTSTWIPNSTPFNHPSSSSSSNAFQTSLLGTDFNFTQPVLSLLPLPDAHQPSGFVENQNSVDMRAFWKDLGLEGSPPPDTTPVPPQLPVITSDLVPDVPVEVPLPTTTVVAQVPVVVPLPNTTVVPQVPVVVPQVPVVVPLLTPTAVPQVPVVVPLPTTTVVPEASIGPPPIPSTNPPNLTSQAPMRPVPIFDIDEALAKIKSDHELSVSKQIVRILTHEQISPDGKRRVIQESLNLMGLVPVSSGRVQKRTRVDEVEKVKLQGEEVEVNPVARKKPKRSGFKHTEIVDGKVKKGRPSKKAISDAAKSKAGIQTPEPAKI